jgi:hypothetical protein
MKLAIRREPAPIVVTPARLDELKAEAFMTNEQRRQAVREWATPRDDEAFRREAEGAYNRDMRADARARKVHTLKRLATLGIMGSYETAKAKRQRLAHERDMATRAAERQALNADPEYREFIDRRNHEERIVEGATYLTERDGHYSGNLRMAAHNARSAREHEASAAAAEAAGNHELAQELRGYAAGNLATAARQQAEATGAVGRVEDDGRFADYGVGQSRYALSPQDTMAGLHELALREHEARGHQQRPAVHVNIPRQG